MSKIDKTTIIKKLEKLNGVVDKLEQCKRVSREDFMIDFQISDSAMHNLVLGIEVIVDIGNHILSQVFQVRADEYQEVILKLGEMKVVPEKFSKENADMAKFRNLIIHAYLKIDLKEVYQNLQKAPNIFRKFAKYYLEFLERQ